MCVCVLTWGTFASRWPSQWHTFITDAAQCHTTSTLSSTPLITFPLPLPGENDPPSTAPNADVEHNSYGIDTGLPPTTIPYTEELGGPKPTDADSVTTPPTTNAPHHSMSALN